MGRRHPCTQQRGLLTSLMVLALIHQQESCPVCHRAAAVAKAAAVWCQHCSTTFQPQGGSSSEHPVDSVCPQAAPVLQLRVLHAEHLPTHACRAAAAAFPYPKAPTSTAASPPWHHSITSLLRAGSNMEHSSTLLAPTCSTAFLSQTAAASTGESNAPRTASELQYQLLVNRRQQQEQRRMAPHTRSPGAAAPLLRKQLEAHRETQETSNKTTPYATLQGLQQQHRLCHAPRAREQHSRLATKPAKTTPPGTHRQTQHGHPAAERQKSTTPGMPWELTWMPSS